MASLRHTRDPQRRVFFCARWTHDVLTAVASVGDLVFDVLVAIQFYRDHYMIYCTLSIIIFAIAQACYAFLFTSAYASHLPPSKRALVFVVVLPIAQITPVFAWIESLHWPRLQRLMLRMDLRPSDDADAGGDSPWLSFRSRFAAHSGFLAEAVLEAVPQCVLQTVHMIWMGRVETIPLISILLSVFVIVSKGWIVSFSLHRQTLAFNILCTAGDVFGLFAVLCWTFSKVESEHPDQLLDYLLAPSFLRTVNGVLVASLFIAAAALVAAGFVLLVLFLIEDTLCTRRHNRPATPLFVRLVATTLAWFLLQLPLVVLLGTLRLSLLPLAVLRWLDSEHAIHASFYRPLFAYLAHGKGVGFDDDCQLSYEMDLREDKAAAIELQETGDAPSLCQPCAPASARTGSQPRSTSTGRTAPDAHSDRAASRAERLTSTEPPGLRRAETQAEEFCDDYPATPLRQAPGTRAQPSATEAAVLSAQPVGAVPWQSDDTGAVVVAASHQPVVAAKGKRLRRRSPPLEHECESLRTMSVNAFIACARRDVDALNERLRHARSRRSRHLAAAEFAASVGASKNAQCQMTRLANHQANAEARSDTASLPESDPQAGTVSGVVVSGTKVAPWHDGLGITLPWLLRGVRSPSRSPEPLACSSGPVDALLQACAIVCALVAMPLVAIWAAATLVFLPMAAALPIVGPALCLGRREPLPLLATVLSGCYVAVVVAVLGLAPSVRKFQRLRVQLRGASAFPNAFYCAAVASIIAERCEDAAMTAVAYSKRPRMLQMLKYGSVCSICMHHMRPGQRVRELLACSHSFHEDCIFSWIHSTSSTPCCPKCRQPAAPGDIAALDSMVPHPTRASSPAARLRV